MIAGEFGYRLPGNTSRRELTAFPLDRRAGLAAQYDP
jgi:hypothetical protein